MTLEEELLKLEQKYNSDKNFLLLKHKILSGYLANLDCQVYETKLYGAEASVKVEIDKIDRLLDFFKHINPVSLVKTKGTFTSFKPKFFVEQDEKSSEDSVVEICPFTISVEGLFENVSLKCYIKANNIVVNLEVSSRSLRNFFSIETDWIMGRGQKRVRSCELHTHPNTYSIWKNGTGERVAERQTVKWASGGAEYPNNFTVYYVPYGVEKKVRVVDFLKTLMRKKEE